MEKDIEILRVENTRLRIIGVSKINECPVFAENVETKNRQLKN